MTEERIKNGKSKPACAGRVKSLKLKVLLGLGVVCALCGLLFGQAIYKNADQVLNAVFDSTNSLLKVEPGNVANTTPWLVKGPVVQLPALKNSISTSAANTAVSATITGVAGQSGYLQHVEARCSAGSAQLTVQDGATNIFQSGTTEVGTTSYSRDFGTPLAATAGNTLTITLGACGTSNTGTLVVEASQF